MASTNGSVYPSRFLRFLGTAGARFTIMRQLRASGGLWLQLDEQAFSIDPGPGALVRICEAQPPLDTLDLSAILLTHRHIDHSTDLNVLVEAMTEGGFRRRGHVVLPADAITPPCCYLLPYLREKVEALHLWEESPEISLPGGATVSAVRLTHHHVDCFGFVLKAPSIAPVGLMSDARFEERWIDFYRSCPLLVVNMTLPHRCKGIDHLCPDDVSRIVETLAPDLVILTHFGRSVLLAGPEKIASDLTRLGTRVVAARDGMVIDLETLEIWDPLSDAGPGISSGNNSTLFLKEGLP